MEEPQDIFADLLSGLQPSVPKPNEPTEAPAVSMDESRRKATGEPASVAVQRSESPVGEHMTPPPPPLTKDEMVELVRENVRSLLFQSFGALTTSLRTALNGVTDRVAKVETLQLELSTKVESLKESQSTQGEAFTESFRHIESALKEASVGIQRMLEKQDLVDAHILLNRHAREQQEEKRREEVEEVKKSEKKVIPPKEEPVEEASEEEEENPPARTAPAKKLAQPVQREYSPEPKAVKQRLPGGPYPPPAQIQHQVPQSYPMETQPPQQMPPPPQPPPQQMPPQYTPAPPGPQQMPPQAAFKPPVPPYGYSPQPPVAENGYPAPPEKTLPPPMPYPQQMPPASTQFAPPPPPSTLQQPPPRMQSSPPQQPPGAYTGYPSLPPQQSYRPVQPPPPPPQQAIYGSPAGLHTQKPPPPQRAAEPARTSPQSVPLDQVINDVANMGFDRTKVRSVVTDMLNHGEAVDLNVVIDRLTNMGY